MIKKICTILVILCSLTAMCSCGENTTTEKDTNGENYKSEIIYSDNSEDIKANDKAENKTEEQKDNQSSSVYGADTLNELEDSIIEDIENDVSELESEYKVLCDSISSYDDYLNNIKAVESFYDKIKNSSYAISIKLYEYSLTYAETVINSGLPCDDMYTSIDGIYDCIYNDAADNLYDDIYNGILDDMYDDFYNGVISDGYDTTPYKEWSEISYNAYELWSDTRYDSYKYWSDMRSDIYEFWSNLRGAFYIDDLEKAQKIINDFKEDIDKLKKA